MVKLLLMIVMAAFLTSALGAPASASTRPQRNKRAAEHDLAKKKGLISGWVTNWGANTSMPIYEKYDTLSWLGALTTPDGGVNLTVRNPPSAAFTKTNMTTIRPLMTVGGWAGSQFVRDD